MKREYRIGFKITCLVMALESVFWLLWLIFRPLPVLPWPIHGIHVNIWLSDMVLLLLFFIPAIWLWHINEECGMPEVKWFSPIVGLIGAAGALWNDYSLGIALFAYLISAIAVSVMVFVILLLSFIGDMFLQSRPIKRLYDWILR